MLRTTVSYEAVLEETADLLEKYGTTRAISEQTGLPLRTVQARVAKIRTLWPDRFAKIVTPPEPEYTGPTLECADEDLDAMIRRLAATQRRERSARKSSEWMQFSVHGDAPFCLAFIGDPHLDTCDLDTLCSHVDLIAATDRMWAVGLGDYINQWSTKLAHKYAHQAATERDAFRLAEWFFSLPIWWLLISGNHDGMRWHGQGSPLRWMQTAASVPLQDWQAKFQVACGSASWRIWAAHDFPGHSMWNPLHGPGKRAQLTGAMADLFVCGDKHTYGLFHTEHEHTNKPYWIGRARGYKPIDDYATEKGYGEQTIGHSIAAVMNPADGSIECYSDLSKAACYLRFLQEQHKRQ